MTIMYPQKVKTYSVEITGIVEVVGSFTIAACSENEAITNAEILFKQEFITAKIQPENMFNVNCKTLKNIGCLNCYEEQY